IKLNRSPKYLEKGLEQTARYMDIFGCSEGWLLVFEHRAGIEWEQKIYMKKETVDGKTVTVVGL
ncbi:MAG: hypothetical protein LBF08_06495, partial [Dysgonamonadaceae bacterium]|nr:hypothetical protein [Dysgonamonadaceae bacterium]